MRSSFALRKFSGFLLCVVAFSMSASGVLPVFCATANEVPPYVSDEITVCESTTAVGLPLAKALVFPSDHTAIRLSSGAGPNWSALMKNSVFLIWACPPDDGEVAGWIEYQMPPASGVEIKPALMWTTCGSEPVVNGALGIA